MLVQKCFSWPSPIQGNTLHDYFAFNSTNTIFACNKCGRIRHHQRKIVMKCVSLDRGRPRETFLNKHNFLQSVTLKIGSVHYSQMILKMNYPSVHNNGGNSLPPRIFYLMLVKKIHSSHLLHLIFSSKYLYTWFKALHLRLRFNWKWNLKKRIQFMVMTSFINILDEALIYSIVN